MPSIVPIPALHDNYIWLLRRGPNAAVVDPGEAGPVIRLLEQEQLILTAILVTHHHIDHCGAVPELSARYHAKVFEPGREGIPGITDALYGGETIHLAELDLSMEIIAVPGHTRDHIAYYGRGCLFCGDTLFSAGCGRLFEGSPADMMASLGRLAALPESTKVYCAHEYTEDNVRFALRVEPKNGILRQWAEEVALLRAQGQPSLPSTLAREKAINPFLRCAEPAVIAAVQEHQAGVRDPVSVFAALRKWKDHF